MSQGVIALEAAFDRAGPILGRESRRCRDSWSSTIAIRRWRWSTASCPSSRPSRAATAASLVRCARSASAAARCAARTTTARRREALARARDPARPGGARPPLRAARGAAAARGQVAAAGGPEGAQARRSTALRRKQGLLILERLRASYPKLPVVMLTTTGSDLGAERPADPLVYLCENEVVDSRSLAAEISRALAVHHTGQEGGDLLGARARRWPSCGASSMRSRARRCRC